MFLKQMNLDSRLRGNDGLSILDSNVFYRGIRPSETLCLHPTTHPPLILAPDTMHKESMTNQWFSLKINIFQTAWETFTHKIRSENKSGNEISITLSGRLI
ncbi:hypothetical protein CWC45_10140 [Neisseria sp. N177_16]|nr:hypothetical protein CWC45_10140 [Neisseria sp. N177_16]